MALPELPWNNLVEFVKDYTKGLQVLVDSIAPDPGADNSTFAIEPLYEFDSCLWFKGKVRFVTDQFNDGQHGNGYQGLVYASRITLQNNVLHVQTPTYMGKSQPAMDWNGYSAAEYEIVKSVAENITMGIRNNYSGNDIIVHANQYGNVYFQPALHNKSDIGIKYTEMGTERSSSELNIQFQNLTLGWENDYVTNSTSLGDLGTGAITLYQPIKTPIMAVIRNDSEASNLVSVLSPYNTHNQVLNATSQGSYKIYYGDNYIIYSIPSGTLIKYNDIFDSTNTVANTINGWDPDAEPIVVPTYTENKYGPEPIPITDDDYIDMGLGVETDGMAMYNMAVITRDELIALITDFESNADTGLSFIPHVLGLYKLGFESSVLLTTITDKIRLHKEPNGVSAFISAADYSIVEDQEVLIDCGSITVDRKELLTNTFLDFSPYSTYEMFIPGCGWITLPDTIVGRTISVAIVFDLTTCSCKGVVRSEGSLLGGSGTTIATVNGIIGSSVPLSINETGLQRAAIMNGSTQAAMALGTAFMGVGIGNPYMGASGIAMAAGALASNHIAGNSTYTSTKGGATDYSVFGDGWKAVLKITRPVLEIPDNYGHSVGFVVNRYDTLSNFSGFTVCVNPHIHITATSDEKEEIKRLLEEGVILPEGE